MNAGPDKYLIPIIFDCHDRGFRPGIRKEMEMIKTRLALTGDSVSTIIIRFLRKLRIENM